MHRWLAGAALAAALALPASAQSFNGSFATAGTAGQIVLTLRDAPGGQLAGSFSGNGNTFEVMAVHDPEAPGTIAGTITGQGVGLYFEAALQGDELMLLLVEPDAAGEPNYATARQLTLTRQAAVAGAPAPGAGGYPSNAPRLPGASAAPSAAPGGAMGGPGGGMGGAAPTPASDPMARLLTSSAWCSFSYSGTSSYSGSSGATNTSRFEFRPDGSLLITTGSESSSSNPYGSVAGQGSGGQRLFWKVQQGTLMLSQDGAAWQAVPLRVQNNSAGYPIITAEDGTEYMSCN